ncbi:NTP transferase domain-containing protein [Conexibacter sp. DBS9H8]|uniref:nucleotidyltransferase family protein n=1 Tax=Conexibacter sp. DBS9H8 TaxID=2937801 RepID=UPI00200C8D21|nr:nucleotidyltransferase family protein [Conexibacter sp. DBS9H8]
MSSPLPPAAPARDAVGIVLAAGAGRRFGGAKQVAELGGRPLISWPIAALRAGGLSDIIVVLGAHADRVRAVLSGVEVVEVTDWSEGMSASLRAGVSAAAGRGAERAIVALADQPHLSGAAVARVLAASREGHPVCRARYGTIAGHPVALSQATFAAVAELRGDMGARGLTQWTPRDVDCTGLGATTDIDTPEDLAATAPGTTSPPRARSDATTLPPSGPPGARPSAPPGQ